MKKKYTKICKISDLKFSIEKNKLAKVNRRQEALVQMSDSLDEARSWPCTPDYSILDYKRQVQWNLWIDDTQAAINTEIFQIKSKKYVSIKRTHKAFGIRSMLHTILEKKL